MTPPGGCRSAPDSVSQRGLVPAEHETALCAHRRSLKGFGEVAEDLALLEAQKSGDVAKAIGGGVSVLGKAVGQAEKLGGVGEKVAHELEQMTGRESRTVVLGHLLELLADRELEGGAR